MPVRRPRRPILRAQADSLRRELPASERLARACREADLELTSECTSSLAAFLERMLAENQKLNLTAIRELEPAIVLHALDSLEVSRVSAIAKLVLDLGSGNGFPGVAAACLWPGAHVVLVERTQKKAKAIERCLADTGLERVEVIALDVAQVPTVESRLLHCADLVLSRAMGTIDGVIDLATPLMRHGSLLVQWKAADIPASERKAGLVAAKHHNLLPRTDHEYSLHVANETRVRRLVSFLKP